MDGMYHEALLDLYKHPLNKAVPKNYTLKQKATNPLCGDEVEIFLTIKNKRISEIGWQGAGCAISQAATSLTTDAVKNKTQSEMATLTPENVLEWLQLPKLNPTRLRCALLCYEALKKALPATS